MPEPTPATISDSEIITSGPGTEDGPTESTEDKDKGGDGPKDTGDLPTEREDDKDQGGEGEADTGDEA